MDEYNLPSIINAPDGSNSGFSYTHDRQLRKQNGYFGGTLETTYYIGGILEKVVLGGVASWRHHVLAGDSVVAVYTRKSSGTNETYYLSKDHLGSTDVTTSATGAVVVRTSFGGFGQRRNAASWSNNPTAADWTGITATSRRGYTGHSMLDNLNLTHMGGRVYDQITARFLTPDPFVPEPFEGQSLNRYSYVFNNPLRYTDPSGFEPDGECPDSLFDRDTQCPSGGSSDAYETLSEGVRQSKNAALAEALGSPEGYIGSNRTAPAFPQNRQIIRSAGEGWMKATSSVGGAGAGVFSLLGISTANAEARTASTPNATPSLDRLGQLEQFGNDLERLFAAGRVTALEATARLADRAAELYYDPSKGRLQDVGGFIRALAQVGGGLNVFTLSRSNPRLATFDQLGTIEQDSGFRFNLRDGSPQGEHFYGALYASYVGGGIGYAFMDFRELKVFPRSTVEDTRLNALAFNAAFELRKGFLDIRRLGTFIRDNLGDPLGAQP